MSIRTKATRGGAAIAGLLICTILVTAWSMNHIRVGGALHQKNQLLNDFNADILPPPAVVLESFLEVSMMVEHPADAQQHLRRLAGMEQAYHERRAYWAASALPLELKEMLQNTAGVEADRFWLEVNERLLPALQRGDAEEAQASYLRVEEIYHRHTLAIDQMLNRTAQERRAVDLTSRIALIITVLLSALLACATFTILVLAFRALKASALDPLAETAEVMRKLAEGDLTAEVSAAPRANEIGEMLRAIEVFRATALAQRQAERAQHDVVARISGGLWQIASGNLSHRIDGEFPSEYEPLRRSFNSTVAQMQQVLNCLDQTGDGAQETEDDIAIYTTRLTISDASKLGMCGAATQVPAIVEP